MIQHSGIEVSIHSIDVSDAHMTYQKIKKMIEKKGRIDVHF